MEVLLHAFIHPRAFSLLRLRVLHIEYVQEPRQAGCGRLIFTSKLSHIVNFSHIFLPIISGCFPGGGDGQVQRCQIVLVLLPQSYHVRHPLRHLLHAMG